MPTSERRGRPGVRTVSPRGRACPAKPGGEVGSEGSECLGLFGNGLAQPWVPETSHVSGEKLVRPEGSEKGSTALTRSSPRQAILR